MSKSSIEKKIYNKGERLIPGVTHDNMELIRHRSSYLFFKQVIELDIANGMVSKPVKIVDLGCGVGHGCHILAKIPGSQVVGVDVSPESLDYANNNYSKSNISYQLSKLEDFINDMPIYDYVVSRGVMEHIENGLQIILSTKWQYRLLFDVPYNEAAGNPHHLLVGIQENHFSDFPEAELFYEDLNGIIYDRDNKPAKPNMIMCGCSRPDLVKIFKNDQITFPVSAWRLEDGIKEGNNITWYDRKDLLSFAIEKLQPANIVLDIGCGIMPQKLTRPLVHICCEPFLQYIERLNGDTKKELDRQYIIINASWQEAVEQIPPGYVDSIFLLDVLEHLDKEEGLRLLKLTEKITKKQIVVFTPLGFMPQEHPDGKDAWGLNGGTWQQHKSGWFPKDFDDSWDIYGSEIFHTIDSMGMPLKKPFGAFVAIKNIQPLEHSETITNPISIFDDVLHITESLGTKLKRESLLSGLIQKYKMLIEAHNQLLDEHQQLQQSKLIQLSNILEKYPLLRSLLLKVYNVLAKMYNHFQRKK